MADHWLNQYEGKELELFRNYGNPYETISIRVQVDEQCMYVGDEEVEHGPDGGRSIRIFTFDKENTRKAFTVLSGGYQDPVLVLKGMMNEKDRLKPLRKLCEDNHIEFTEAMYF